ncbi:Forkhead box protein N4 [Nymphon striatum]|nr:Forkhead box protein N4 [Nymphon striatum]
MATHPPLLVPLANLDVSLIQTADWSYIVVFRCPIFSAAGGKGGNCVHEVELSSIARFLCGAVSTGGCSGQHARFSFYHLPKLRREDFTSASSEIGALICCKRALPLFQDCPKRMEGKLNSVRHNLSLNKCFEKIVKPDTGTQRKGCLWAMNPAKITKMDEEIQKWKRKDPEAIRTSMSKPGKKRFEFHFLIYIFTTSISSSEPTCIQFKERVEDLNRIQTKVNQTRKWKDFSQKSSQPPMPS